MKNLLKSLTALLLAFIFAAGLMVPAEAEAATSKYMTRLDFIKNVVNTINATDEKAGVVDKLNISADSVAKYMTKYSISEEDAKIFTAAVKMKLITASQFKSLKSKITNQSAFIILAKADEYLNGETVDKNYAKDHIDDVYGLKKSSMKAAKKIWVVKAYILGYMNCYGNTNVKLTAKATKAAMLSAIQLLDFDFDEYMANKGVNKAIGFSFYSDIDATIKIDTFNPKTGVDAVLMTACTAEVMTAEELNSVTAAKYDFKEEAGYEWIYTEVSAMEIDYAWQCNPFNFRFELVDTRTGKLVDTRTRTGAFTLTYNGEVYENCEYVGWTIFQESNYYTHRFAVKVPTGCRSLEIVTGDGEYQCLTFGEVLDWTQLYYPLDPAYRDYMYDYDLFD